MASEEHKQLATTIKQIHNKLRGLTAEVGAEEAWKIHLQNEDDLKIYAESMNQLSEKYWKRNSAEDDRISWIVSYCEKYFYGDEIEKWRLKELRTIKALRDQGLRIETEDEPQPMTIEEKIETLDVGSSGNFFSNFKQFNILPIDISPSHDSVAYCDFLSVKIADQLQLDDMKVEALPLNHFHAVIFSLLLEYLPTSEQRIICCEKAWKVLKLQGLLIIVTPDSNHQAKNSRQIKNWRWTLAKIGFTRIKVEKLKNLTCMAFRKTPECITNQWAETHKESYMEFKIEIPQDKVKLTE